MSEILVQYIVMRTDLIKMLAWPTGAVVAQACHASTAVLHIFREDSNTKTYLENLDSMHKIVLEAPDADNLKQLSSELTNANIDHKLWTEQPENEVTCLATKPYPKQTVNKYFKQFKLMK